ncbi:MAG: hypothetical protein EZS28_040396 [Streblomastix strix]|uniref:Fido domain-containing protein n=1 Tax=Streblomastix strix TaxID=222440 RepID=A0A5J4U0K1_9EUKA|nr:MAG: hypothetical protein EZS28_040396 [Streblomastix strix]
MDDLLLVRYVETDALSYSFSNGESTSTIAGIIGTDQRGDIGSLQTIFSDGDTDLFYDICYYQKQQLACYKLKQQQETGQYILPKDTINDAIEYLKNNKMPLIDELYQTLFQRDTFRQCNVYVSDKNNSKIISAANIGIQHENIEPNELQQLVNFAYEYVGEDKIIVMFACYLLYERIHPHIDGNGRMGRLMFLENLHQLPESFVPLSSTLRHNNLEQAERIAAEQRQRAQQRYRIQRQNFRAQANDLQLLLIRRLQKTVINNMQDLLQINDIIEHNNTFGAGINANVIQAIEF